MLSMALEMQRIFSCPMHSRRGHSGRGIRKEAQFYYYSQDIDILSTFRESLGENY